MLLRLLGEERGAGMDGQSPYILLVQSGSSVHAYIPGSWFFWGGFVGFVVNVVCVWLVVTPPFRILPN